MDCDSGPTPPPAQMGKGALESHVTAAEVVTPTKPRKQNSQVASSKEGVDDSGPSKGMKRKAKTNSDASLDEIPPEGKVQDGKAPKGKGKGRGKGGSASKTSLDESPNGELDAEKPGKRVKKPKPEGPYTKYKESGEPIPEPVMSRGQASASGNAVKVISWNVGGLRAVLRNRAADLSALVEKEAPDVLGILETKLQEDGVEAATKDLLAALPDYTVVAAHCSTKKKGYSGVAVLLRKGCPQPLKVEPEDLPSALGEGRLVTVEFAAFFVVFAYVPNSGDGLKRLDERIDQWDAQLLARIKALTAKKPTLLIGDLNVAHLDEDIWNVEAPHIAKSAGTTPQERSSFAKLLDAGFVDGFRHLNQDVLGAFTYWSVRAGNRPKNRGLRLDYAIVSKDMISKSPDAEGTPSLADAFHAADFAPGGDHCPVGAVVVW
uniref:DNA-(apurinic or apyrimidinic site) endonuclease n=1 Tax=Noctiluca scintillans TaxID=2966 RepID=A0A7S1EZ40_NOCSC